MKKIATILSVVAILAFAACGDNSNTSEDQQVVEPVDNSGPQTEGERATDAVKDSANAGSDSTVRTDANAPSNPH